MIPHEALLVIAIEADRKPDKSSDQEMEHARHREHMEKMMMNLANSAVRQEAGLKGLDNQVSGVSEQIGKVAKKIDGIKPPKSKGYTMEVIRDDEGRIVTVEVNPK